MLRQLAIVLVALALVVACGATPPPPGTDTATVQIAGASATPVDRPADAPVSRGAILAGSPVTVNPDDATLGAPDALVTVVEFVDLEDSLTLRLHETMRQIVRERGADVRWVLKHRPLAFHENARRAAQLVEGFRAAAGDDAAFAYVDALAAGEMPGFDRRAAFFDDAATKVAQRLGIAPDLLAQRTQVDGAARVEKDLALAEALETRRSPTYFINGTRFVSPSRDQLGAAIDAELTASRLAAERGTKRTGLYAARVAENFPKNPPVQDTPAADPLKDKTVWRIPLGKSPARGSATALVTIVELVDFECPYCAKVQPTLKKVAAKYGDKVRFVYKAHPLPMHKRAAPAAHLAFEVGKQKGDDAFWKAHDEIFDKFRTLDDATLEAIAANAGADAKKAMAAVKREAHKKAIETDVDLSEDFDATGTPTFFVNGRRLTGSQSIDVFSTLVDEQLAIAEKLVAEGVAPGAVYERIMKDATPAPPLDKKKIPAPTAQNAQFGKGPIVVQVFSDLQCPYCAKLAPTLAALEKAHPGEVKVVFRNLPLVSHPEARRAAAIGLEVKKQKGDEAFWKYHDGVFARQKEIATAMFEVAAELGVDRQRLDEALAKGTHEKAIAADEKIAKDAKIEATPGTVVGSVFVSGNQPLFRLERALRAHKRGR